MSSGKPARRVLPFVVAHWLMNAGDVLVEVLLPIFR